VDATAEGQHGGGVVAHDVEAIRVFVDRRVAVGRSGNGDDERLLDGLHR
jgi:hypothetical protein